MPTRYLLLCLLLLVGTIAFTQNYHHNVFSLGLTLADTINRKTELELSLQKRTQGTALENNNFFKSSQLKNILFWLNFDVSDNSQVSVSPFGYYESFALNTKPDDEYLPPVKEYRFSARFADDHPGRFVEYSNRYTVEYRLRNLKHDGIYKTNFRVRYRAKLEKSLRGISSRKPVTFQVSDEVFLQFGKAVRNRPNVFDQNRVYVGFDYEMFKNFKTRLAYLYTFQERSSGEEFDNVNMLWVVLKFENLFTQFRRK